MTSPPVAPNTLHGSIHKLTALSWNCQNIYHGMMISLTSELALCGKYALFNKWGFSSAYRAERVKNNVVT
jgi:hypothetical protein